MENDQEELQPLVTPSLDKNGMPPLTKWHSMGLIKFIWVIPETSDFFINTTRSSFWPYGFALAMLIWGYFWWKENVFPIISPKFAFLRIIQPIFLSVAILCMEIARFKNPGFLPWNWSLTKKHTFSQNELRSGNASNEAQCDWAKSHDSPNRCWFSSQSGWFVLRGDHLCGWLGNWVGQRNHRYFVLALFYGVLYSIPFSITVIYALFKHYIKTKWYVLAFLLFFNFAFVNSGILQFITQCCNLTKNTLTVERFTGNAGKYFHGDYLEGWEEICGPRKLLPLWFLPIPLPESTEGFSYVPNPDFVPCTNCNKEANEKPADHTPLL